MNIFEITNNLLNFVKMILSDEEHNDKNCPILVYDDNISLKTKINIRNDCLIAIHAIMDNFTQVFFNINQIQYFITEMREKGFVFILHS